MGVGGVQYVPFNCDYLKISSPGPLSLTYPLFVFKSNATKILLVIVSNNNRGIGMHIVIVIGAFGQKSCIPNTDWRQLLNFTTDCRQAIDVNDNEFIKRIASKSQQRFGKDR